MNERVFQKTLECLSFYPIKIHQLRKTGIELTINSLIKTNSELAKQAMSLLRKWNKIKTAELDEHRNIKNDRIRKIEQKLRLNNIQENVEYEENTFVEKFSSDEIITVESEEDDDYANMITGENKENHIKIYENIAYNIFGSVENNKKIVDRKSRYPTRRFEEETEMTDMENEGINMPIKRMKTVETYPVFGEWSFKNVGRLTSCYHHINKSFFLGFPESNEPRRH